MTEVIGLAIVVSVFALLAVASLLWGAESRPYFDERPVRDDRPNWWAWSRSAGD